MCVEERLRLHTHISPRPLGALDEDAAKSNRCRWDEGD